MSTSKRGIELLHDPLLNKSTAFTEAEKKALGLVGLVPDITETEDLQLQRVMLQLAQKPTDLERYIYLINLLDHNETLFYRTVMSDPARFLPIVYDPTIGEACLKFGHIYRQARGMYLSMARRGKVKQVLQNWPQKDVRFICFYIFPAIGMAVFATQATRVTDEMFIEAARAVADQVPSELLKQGLLYPLQSNILETEIQTAARIAKLAFDSRLARVERPADMVAFIRDHVYKPEYGEEPALATEAA